MQRSYRWELAFFAVAIGWGATFVVVKDAVAIAPPLLFMTIRFAIGGVLLAAIRPSEIRALRRRTFGISALIGVFLFAGYAFQTIGLQYTTASSAGFVTGLYVVFTPLFGALLLRKHPSRATLAGVGLATGGLFLLSRPHGGLNKGDILVLGAAVAFAVQILLLGKFAREIPAGALATVQLLVVAACSGVATLLFEPGTGLGSATVWFAVGLTVVAGTTVPFWVQAHGQRRVPPTRTAIIFTGEPLFAAAFGTWIQHDPMTAGAVAGGALILAGMLSTEVFAPAEEAL